MTIEVTTETDAEVTCENCKACCCRLEVMLISDTGVPESLIEIDQWGGMVMARLFDGWCAALDRDTMHCMIYDKRPQICRDLEMGEYECISIRAENL